MKVNTLLLLLLFFLGGTVAHLQAMPPKVFEKGKATESKAAEERREQQERENVEEQGRRISDPNVNDDHDDSSTLKRGKIIGAREDESSSENESLALTLEDFEQALMDNPNARRFVLKKEAHGKSILVAEEIDPTHSGDVQLENLEVVAAFKTVLQTEYPKMDLGDLFTVNPVSALRETPALSAEKIETAFERIENLTAPLATPAQLESAKNALQEYAIAASGAFEELTKLSRDQDQNIIDHRKQDEHRTTILRCLKEYEEEFKKWLSKSKKEELGKIGELKAAAKAITYQIINGLDFNTTENGAVFWTGYDKKNIRNQDTAMIYAKNKMKKTIEMTRDGKLLDQLEMYRGDSPIAIDGKSKLGDILFDAASTKFAQSAKGNVTAVIYKPETAEKELAFKKSAYNRIEKLILLENQKQGSVVLKELIVPPEATIALLEEIEKLQKELEHYKEKEADLIKREEELDQAKAALESSGKPISPQHEEELIQKTAALEAEKKKTAEESEALIKKIEDLLGINADDAEKPVILDEIYEALGRKVLGQPALDDPFENLDPDDQRAVGELANRTNLEARTSAYEHFSFSLNEYKRAKNKLQRWKKRWKELHPTSTIGELLPDEEKENDDQSTIVSAESSMSQLSSIPPPETFLMELLDSTEQENQIRELKVKVKKLKRERQRLKEAWCNIIKEQENRVRETCGEALLDVMQPLPRDIEDPCLRMDETIRSKIADQRKMEESRKEYANNQRRWVARVKLDEAAKKETEVKTNEALEQAMKEREEAEQLYLELVEATITEATEQNREEDIKLLDRSISRLWENFHEVDEERTKREVPLFTFEKILEAKDFFERVNKDFFQHVENAERLNLEEGRTRNYIKTLQHEMIQEACEAFLQGKEKPIHSALMSQSAALSAVAREGMSQGAPKRIAQRHITISNAYQYALTLFEKEVERLDRIKKYWEHCLIQAATAYAEGETALWKALTHEERRAYNNVAKVKNKKQFDETQEKIQALKESLQEAKTRAKQFFIFSSNKEEALKAVEDIKFQLAREEAKEQERKNAIIWGRKTEEEIQAEQAFFQNKAAEAEKLAQEAKKEERAAYSWDIANSWDSANRAWEKSSSYWKEASKALKDKNSFYELWREIADKSAEAAKLYQNVAEEYAGNYTDSRRARIWSLRRAAASTLRQADGKSNFISWRIKIQEAIVRRDQQEAQLWEEALNLALKAEELYQKSAEEVAAWNYFSKDGTQDLSLVADATLTQAHVKRDYIIPWKIKQQEAMARGDQQEVQLWKEVLYLALKAEEIYQESAEQFAAGNVTGYIGGPNGHVLKHDADFILKRIRTKMEVVENQIIPWRVKQQEAIAQGDQQEAQLWEEALNLALEAAELHQKAAEQVVAGNAMFSAYTWRYGNTADRTLKQAEVKAEEAEKMATQKKEFEK